MMSGKILILDDKPQSEDFSTSMVLSRLTVNERQLVDYFETAETLWSESNNDDDIDLIKDFSNYAFIFIHDSFESPLVRDGLKVVLFEKLTKTSKVVLFSGSRKESEIPIEKIYDEKISKETLCYEILRRQYFNNLANFIDSYLITGEYKIKYLYNPYINPKKDKAYSFLEIIKTELEESTQCAVASSSFFELISLYGYKNISEISDRFLRMTDDEFIENIEDLIENN